MPTPRVSERLEGTADHPPKERTTTSAWKVSESSTLSRGRGAALQDRHRVKAPPMHQPLLLGRGDGWLALDKPAGLSVFPPHADPGGQSLLSWLLDQLPEQAAPCWPAGFEGGIAHRLDVATSGQVIIARSLADLAAIRRLFEQHLLHKEYRFLSWREVPWDRHEVERPIAHDRHRKARMVVQRGQTTPHRGAWYPAHTRLQRAGPTLGRLSEWTAWMSSGVTHQIRVHSAFAGLALAGDGLYGGGPPTPEALAFAEESGLASPPFHLHHIGLRGPGLEPPASPCPSWWRTC